MNATSRPMPTSAPTVVPSTRRAGPSSRVQLKAEPIAQSEGGLGAAERAVLVSHVAGEVLTRREAEARAAAKRARGEAADLVRLREVFCAHRVEEIRGQRPLPKLSDGKAQPREARRPPLGSGGGKAAAGLGDRKRPSPVVRQVEERAARERQNPRTGKPEPVLLVGGFHGAQEARFAHVEPAPILKKCLAPGNNPLVAARCAARGQRAAAAESVGGAACEFRCLLAEPLVEAAGKNRGPSRAPFGAQAGGL